MNKIELTDEQIKVLDEEFGIQYPDMLREIPGKKLHQYMVSSTAWSDGEDTLIFVDETGSEQKQFIYYAGLERDAELVMRYKGVSVYTGVGEMERYLDQEEECCETD